jgi:hypothetical protein
MTPALAAVKESKQAKRFVGMSMSLGLHNPNLVPEGAGRDYKPSRYLKSIQDLRNDFTVVSGSSHPGVYGRSHGGRQHLLGLPERPRCHLAQHDLARPAHGEASGA